MIIAGVMRFSGSEIVTDVQLKSEVRWKNKAPYQTFFKGLYN